MHKLFATLSAAILGVLTLGGCQTTGGNTAPSGSSRAEMEAGIAAEPSGYYVGRRYYKKDYKFWGYIRKSGQPWKTAQLVCLNENTKFAPDRAQGSIGSDNNYEYKLTGDFTGEKIYEPASNRFYPEFRLRDAQVLSTTPAPIYREGASVTDPARRVIATPY